MPNSMVADAKRMLDDVSLEARHGLIDNQLDMWRNTLYNASINAKVAEVLEDDKMVKGAREDSKRAIKAIALLDELKSRLPPLDGDEETSDDDSEATD